MIFVCVAYLALDSFGWSLEDGSFVQHGVRALKWGVGMMHGVYMECSVWFEGWKGRVCTYLMII